MRNKHYVGILVNDTIRYVTEFDRSTGLAIDESGKEALALSKAAAEDCAFGLRLKGHTAAVIKLPYFEHPFNPTKEEWFGIVRWCEDDIRAALLDEGFEPTHEAIDLIRFKMENHGFTYHMIDDGWDRIHQYIADEAENLEEREVF